MQVLHRRKAFRGGGSSWEPPQLASLVGAWVSGLSGDVGAGGTWLGQYGTSHNLTLVGNAVVNSGGLVLDGTGDYATKGAGVLSAVTNVSIACWARTTDAAGAFQPVLEAGSAPSGFTFCLRDFDAALVSAYLQNRRWLDTAFPTQSNQWTHLALVLAPVTGLMSIYVNGALEVAETSGAAGDSTYMFPFMLGRAIIDGTGNHYLVGAIDCAYAYNTALSDADVLDLYANDTYKRSVGT